MTAACRVDIRTPPKLIQVIFGNMKPSSRITTCEVHVGGEHLSGAKTLDFNTSPTEHTAEHHITPAVSELTTEYDIMLANSGLTSDDVLALKLKSCSMKNFAVKLMRELFTKEELENKTVKSTRSAKGGKEGLDKRRLQIIKDYVLQFYSTLPEKTEKVWSECVNAMNEVLRRKR